MSFFLVDGGCGCVSYLLLFLFLPFSFFNFPSSSSSLCSFSSSPSSSSYSSPVPLPHLTPPPCLFFSPFFSCSFSSQFILLLMSCISLVSYPFHRLPFLLTLPLRYKMYNTSWLYKLGTKQTSKYTTKYEIETKKKRQRKKPWSDVILLGARLTFLSSDSPQSCATPEQITFTSNLTSQILLYIVDSWK